MNLYKLEFVLDPNISKLTPGNYLKFNYICKEFKISPKNNFTENLSLLLDLYNKNKDILFINIILFMADYYLRYLNKENILKNDKLFELKILYLKSK